jgi:cell division transport system permease protein
MGLLLAFREAFRGFWRTGMVGLISIATIGASLLVLGIFGQVVMGGYALFDRLQERVEVDVYFRDGVHRRQALALARDIEALPGIAEVNYIDQDAAAKEFQDMFGAGMLNALSQNPLPVSLRVRMKPGSDLPQRLQAVSNIASANKDVESVDVGETWVGALERFVQVITGVGLLLGSVLCLACGFAVSNTAKLMVLAQREAIEIMRLVGATGSTVRLTFLVGGALQGCAGGFLASLGQSYASAWWTARVPDLALDASIDMNFWLVVLGTVLGVVGSWASLNRVLNAVSIK